MDDSLVDSGHRNTTSLLATPIRSGTYQRVEGDKFKGKGNANDGTETWRVYEDLCCSSESGTKCEMKDLLGPIL